MSEAYLMEKHRTRMAWLDVMKTLAAFMVCFYHLTENNKVVDFGHFENDVYIVSIEKILYGLLTACVPLFFIASGTVLKLKKYSTYSKLRKVIQLLVINSIWGFICNILLNWVDSGCFYFEINYFLQVPFYLWYLPTLSFIYAFDIVWCRIKENKWSVVLFYFIMLIPFTINLVGDILVYYDHSYASCVILHSGFLRIYSLLFVLIPLYWNKLLSMWPAFALVAVGIVLVWFEVEAFSNATGSIYNGVNSSFPTWGAFFVTLGIYNIVRRIPETLDFKLFEWIGSNCLGIYILHYPFIALSIKFCNVLNYGWGVQFVFAAVIVLLSSFVSWSLKKMGLRYLI